MKMKPENEKLGTETLPITILESFCEYRLKLLVFALLPEHYRAVQNTEVFRKSAFWEAMLLALNKTFCVR